MNWTLFIKRNCLASPSPSFFPFLFLGKSLEFCQFVIWSKGHCGTWLMSDIQSAFTHPTDIKVPSIPWAIQFITHTPPIQGSTKHFYVPWNSIYTLKSVQTSTQVNEDLQGSYLGGKKSILAPFMSKVNPMRATCQLVKINSSLFIGPIRGSVWKLSFAKLWCNIFKAFL